jgi:hypothetical protein
MIKKLEWNVVMGEADAADSILGKLNEVIDAVNEIMEIPRIRDSLDFQKSVKNENRTAADLLDERG